MYDPNMMNQGAFGANRAGMGWRASRREQQGQLANQQNRMGNMQDRMYNLQEQYKGAGSDQHAGIQGRMDRLQGRMDRLQGNMGDPNATGANRAGMGWRQERRQAKRDGSYDPNAQASYQQGGSPMDPQYMARRAAMAAQNAPYRANGMDYSQMAEPAGGNYAGMREPGFNPWGGMGNMVPNLPPGQRGNWGQQWANTNPNQALLDSGMGGNGFGGPGGGMQGGFNPWGGMFGNGFGNPGGGYAGWQTGGGVGGGMGHAALVPPPTPQQMQEINAAGALRSQRQGRPSPYNPSAPPATPQMGGWNPLTTPTSMGNMFETQWGRLVPSSTGNQNVFQREGDPSMYFHYDPSAQDGVGAMGGWKSMSPEAYAGYGDYAYKDPRQFGAAANPMMQQWTRGPGGFIQGMVGTGAYA